MSRRSRLLPLATAGLLLLAVACADSDARSGDTTEVGAQLLGSRMESGTVPQARGGISRVPDDRPAPPPPPDITLDELGHNTGSSDAPLRIVEFSDFGCGYCRTFHLEVYPVLEEEYLDTGMFEWKYVPIIIGLFGPTAEVAALAGECALAQGRFPAVRDRLFADQSAWKGDDRAREVIRSLVEDEGLDMAAWDRCMESGERMERIRAGTALARGAGVRGTPTFFILGVGAIPGALPLETFREVLDQVHAQATAASGPEAESTEPAAEEPGPGEPGSEGRGGGAGSDGAGDG